jgi:LAO/AO transport system kinase
VVAVVESIEAHAKHLKDTGELKTRRAESIKTELLAMVGERIRRHIEKNVTEAPDFAKTIVSLQQRAVDPYLVADNIINRVIK